MYNYKWSEFYPTRGVITPHARLNQHQAVTSDAAFSTYGWGGGEI